MTAQPLDTAVLLYVATATRASRSLAGLRQAISPWLDDSQQLDNTVLALLERGWLRREGRLRLEVTPAGAAEAARTLGIERLPARLRWTSARNLILAHALGVADASKLARAEGLAAAAVARDQGMATGAAPGRVRDALVWRQLGADSARPLTLEGVRRHVLGQMVGGSRNQSSDAMMRQIAARALRARGVAADELQRAIFSRWMASSEPALPEFADAVVSTARRSHAGRSANGKVFISHVARAIGGDPERFKERLLQAHRERLLALERADSAGGLDPVDVAESETRDGVAEYHFVMVPDPTP